MSEEKVCDCVGDGKAWSAFEPEEFAGGIEFEKDVPVVGCENDVDGAVVQGEVIHEAQDFFFDLIGGVGRAASLEACGGRRGASRERRGRRLVSRRRQT